MRALALGLVLLAAGSVGYCVGARSPEDEPQPDRIVEVKESPSVITALQRLSRLEGAAVHLERVIDLQEKQSRFFGLIEAKDAILLIAAGDVTAGIDLAELKAEDIVIDHEAKRVKVRLPRATIFSTRVDNDRTYVHTRSTDTLAERQMHLETEARREAERGFRKAATEAGIERLADESVARTVRALVLSLGFSEVEVVFSGGEGEMERAPKAH